jgi:hypothetical protein
MIAVATAQLSSFLVCFKLFLKKNEMELIATHQAPSRGAGSEQGKREREGAYLTYATSPIHFCRKMLGVEGGVLDHPKALNDLVLTKPCTYISNPVLKIEQFLPSERVSDDEGVNLSVLFYYCTWYAVGGYLICHVVNIEAPILILIINTHSSQ